MEKLTGCIHLLCFSPIFLLKSSSFALCCTETTQSSKQRVHTVLTSTCISTNMCRYTHTQTHHTHWFFSTPVAPPPLWLWTSGGFSSASPPSPSSSTPYLGSSCFKHFTNDSKKKKKHTYSRYPLLPCAHTHLLHFNNHRSALRVNAPKWERMPAESSAPRRESNIRKHTRLPFLTSYWQRMHVLRAQIDTHKKKKKHTHAEKIVQIPVWTEQRGGNKK